MFTVGVYRKQGGKQEENDELMVLGCDGDARERREVNDEG